MLMKTIDRPPDHATENGDMSKKKTGAAPHATQQMNIRVAGAIYKRIEKTAETLGLDPTNFVRMLIMENLAAYEERAERVRKHGQEG